jgi:ribA/ribD-fused uncharacterized protein
MGVTIEIDGEVITFPTSEHAFVYAKLDPSETWRRDRVRGSGCTAGQAKRFGSRPAKMRPGWEEPGSQGRWAWMEKILKAKFDQDPMLKRDLLMTGDEQLVEYNEWHDNLWGSCTCGSPATCRSPKATPPHRGENWLGRLLMALRAEYRGAWTDAEVQRGYQ